MHGMGIGGLAAICMCAQICLTTGVEAASASSRSCGPRISARITLLKECRRAFSRGIQMHPLRHGTICPIKIKIAMDHAGNTYPSKIALWRTLKTQTIEPASVRTCQEQELMRAAKTAPAQAKTLRFAVRIPSGMPLSKFYVTDASTSSGSQHACAKIRRRYETLLAAAQACKSDADCGQPLAIGCGCTSGPVANNTTNPQAIYAVIKRAEKSGCLDMLPLVTVCTCRRANGLRCQDRRCDWNFED